MKSKNSLSRVCFTTFALCLMLSGCSDKPEDMMLSAKAYLGKNDNKAAIIQLKNVLQVNPNLPEARYLLGSTLLDSGEGVGAELELRKALAMGYSQDQVLPQLAKAMLASGQSKKLMDEFGKTRLEQAPAKASLETSLSNAYAIHGMTEQSQAALKSALEAEPNYAPALIAQARYKASQRDFDGSLTIIDRVITKYSKDSLAWKVKGDILLYGKGKVDEALMAYRKAVEITPGYLDGNTAVMSVLLQQRNLGEAANQIVRMKSHFPNHPQTKYLEGQLAFQNKDFKLARELMQQVLKVAPDYVPGLQLAGATELQLNSNIQAEGYLSKAVQLAPDAALARRLLVISYLRSNQSARALAALLPALGTTSPDSELLTLAGEVYLQNGDVKNAEESFSKVAKRDPTNAKNRTSLAITHLMGGQTQLAFDELQNIAASDSGTGADLALISAHLSRQELDNALKAIERLEKKQPGKPMTAYLEGRTFLAKREVVRARHSFERSVAIDSTYFPAVASLAALDLSEKKPENAKKRFEAVLAKDPKNTQAMLALADVAVKSGAPKEEVLKLINIAVSADPADATPRLFLIDFYIRNKDFKSAVLEAQNAVLAFPRNFQLLETLGRSQVAGGEFNQAVATYSKLADIQPNSARPYLMLGDAQLRAKNKEAASASLRKALEITPNLVEAQRALIVLDLEQNRFQNALNAAIVIQKQRPREVVGYLLEGDIHAVQKKWNNAIISYQLGLKQVNSNELAIKLHSAFLISEKLAEADKFSFGWLKDHPDDIVFMAYLGDTALMRKDYTAAEKYYLSVIKLRPDSAATYNNLAWVSGRLNRDAAVGYAEKAIVLSPNQPAFLDTLAMLLSNKGDYARAIELENKAVVLQPENNSLKLNLAKIHLKGGNKVLAKKQLTDLEKLGDKFASQSEVASLLKTL